MNHNSMQWNCDRSGVVPWEIHWRQLEVRYEPDRGVIWYAMNPRPRPCFNEGLLKEIQTLQRQVGRLARIRDPERPVNYLVAHSAVPKVFNLGGDLDLFSRLIRRRDEQGLLRYGLACIDVLYANAIHLDLHLTTLSLVQGKALGGGFEAALSSNVVIAERDASMGFPEILFNLFPGMGAYTLLASKLSPAMADRMIASGRTYSAQELFEAGLVDAIADNGKGEPAVNDYIARHAKQCNGREAIRRVRETVRPVRYEELREVLLIWVEAALNLGERDLRHMERFVRLQQRLDSPARSPGGHLSAVASETPAKGSRGMAIH
jgi:DSF synthase